MKRKPYLIACILMGALSYSSFALADLCKTHQTCAVGETCSCTLAPSGGYARSFYLDFSQLQQNHIYSCTFSNKLQPFTLLLTESTIPEGALVKNPSENTHFPLELTLDTNQMVDKDATMTLKYFVPSSDMPDNITAKCEITS